MSKAILIPGNGVLSSDLRRTMWYGWLAEKLRGAGLEITTPSFPDPLYAHESIWKAFCVSELGLDHNTIVIGHSSGAACALRLMEEHQIAGCVLVAAYDSDLGDRIEAESGYFSRPFDYVAMRKHTPWILQFHGSNDHLVPLEAGRRVAQGLGVDLIEVPGAGHFQEKRHEEIWAALQAKLAS
eukprot:TRINITY_DN16638_c0_g1_i1.p1 TRINITY_DN16638_c0_g1~~TRINITY_DN16638_c0_g1_i1.p1  ORF type:complete len:183 (-),score=31.71 TRINITY_DN16638_c0_g1_i1:74-622(-)